MTVTVNADCGLGLTGNPPAGIVSCALSAGGLPYTKRGGGMAKGKVTATAIVTGEALVDYDRRRQRADQRMRAIGHGSKLNCSIDMRMNPGTVSNVLVGRYINDDVLRKVEQWIELQEAGGPVAAEGVSSVRFRTLDELERMTTGQVR